MLSLDEREERIRSLLEYFGEKADYRGKMAEKSPWSAGKNDSYAKSISRILSYICDLPKDDPSLQKLLDCPHLWSAEMFSIPHCCTAADTEAIHCGPRGDVIKKSECKEWFSAWVDCLIAEVDKNRKEIESWYK